MKTYNVAVIGCGHWGPNLIRNFMAHPRTKVVSVSDRDPVALGRIASPSSPFRLPPTAYRLPPTDPSVDLVAIATPVDSHYDLAMSALSAGKHVLVEKPMARDSQEAEDLVAAANRAGRLLAVDHTYLFSPAFARLREAELGRLLVVDSVRGNLGRWQPGLDAIWDLAPHDLAILASATSWPVPEVLSATRTPDGATGWVALRYGATLAHLTLSWRWPEKIRRMNFVGDRAMAVWDDGTGAPLLILDRGADFTVSPPAYWNRGLAAPSLAGPEPLYAEIDHLVQCLDGGGLVRLLNDGYLGLAVVRTLEEIDRKAVTL